MRNLLAISLVCLAGCYGSAEASTEQKAVVYHQEPIVTTNENNNTICVTADISGLGNDDVNIDISGTFAATTVCRNHGNNVAPGQGTIPLSVTFPTQSVQPKNGRARFTVCSPSVTGSDFPVPSSEQAGCPNGNWTVDAISTANITIQSYSVQISQDGQVLFSQSG